MEGMGLKLTSVLVRCFLGPLDLFEHIRTLVILYQFHYKAFERKLASGFIGGGRYFKLGVPNL